MSKQVTRQSNRQPTKQQRRQERRDEQKRIEQERLRAIRNRRIALISTIVAVLVVAAISTFFYWNAQHQSSQASSSTAPLNSPYPKIDNVTCDQGEHNDFHIHAHLTIYINNQLVPVPQNVGIASDGSCLYWLHTHSTDGVIHIEAPADHSFMLGNFLHVWDYQFQSLGYPSQLSSSDGWQAYVGGKLYTGNINTIPLNAHSVITLMYHTTGKAPDTEYAWNGL